jgi:hypothetical protein
MHIDDNEEAEIERLRQALKEPRAKRRSPPKLRPTTKDIAQRTTLAPDAPAPHLDLVIADQGLEPTERALEAWNARLSGAPIVDIAHQMGVSIELAKKLIQEVHTAIYEDLKTNLDLNRQLDLGRIDALIKAFLPAAKSGDDDAANVVLRCLTQRSKLTGTEPTESVPRGPTSPNNVLVWIQAQLPSINRIVDQLPLE